MIDDLVPHVRSVGEGDYSLTAVVPDGRIFVREGFSCSAEAVNFARFRLASDDFNVVRTTDSFVVHRETHS